MVKLVCALVGVVGSAFPVDIDSHQSVGDLKKAIKAEINNPEPAKDRQLFLSKSEGGAWLDKDEAAALSLDEHGHLQGFTLMKASLFLSNPKNFGENFQSGEGHVHVLVVVPEQGMSVPTVFQDGVFDLCSDPFFSQFTTADEIDSWLEFPPLLPLIERHKFYVRASYKVIAEQALTKVDTSRRKYIVITGTPGIGKSVFVYYVMWKLIKDNKRVLFFSKKKGPIYFDGSTMFQFQLLPNTFNQRFWSADLWCLVDSEDPTAMSELPIEDCSVLLVSTPATRLHW